MGSTLTVFVTTFPANPYLLSKPGKQDVTLTSFTAHLSELARFPSVRMRQIDHWEGIEN